MHLPHVVVIIESDARGGHLELAAAVDEIVILGEFFPFSKMERFPENTDGCLELFVGTVSGNEQIIYM